MSRFGVGRNTVREAVQTLVSQGLLDVRPGRGTTVLGLDGGQAIAQQFLAAQLTDTAVDDLYAFRLLLETEIAARAAERADEDDKKAVSDALRQYQRAAEEGSGAYRKDVAFHAAIARASKNTAYIAALDAVANTLVAVRRRTDEVPGAVEQAALDHEAIAKFILDGNPDAARAAMHMHIETAKQALADARLAAADPGEPEKPQP